MFATFRVKNIFAPGNKTLLWSVLCWVMFAIGFSLLLLPFFDLTTESGMYWYQIANFCACFLLTVICFMPFLKESMGYTVLKRLPLQILIGYGIEFVLAFAVSILVSVLRILLSETTVNINQELVLSFLNYNPIPMLLCTGLLVPITEECLFRGVLFAPLCRWKPWVAYILSASAFTFLHLIASIGSMSWFNLLENTLTYLPSGIALGWIYQRSGTIIGPIALHCTMNLIAVGLNLLLF